MPRVRRRPAVEPAEARPWSAAVTAAAAATGLVVLVWLALRRPLADAVEQGMTVWWFGTTFPTFGAEPLAVVDRWAQVVAGFVAVAAVVSTRNRRFWQRFLLVRGSPVDVAVLRVVIFGVLAVLPRVRQAVDLAALPEELRTPRAGMPWLLEVLPAVSPEVIGPLAVAFVVACVLACVGWWTRPAAVTAVVLGLFVFAVVQSYGKVTHFHHLWWIAAVLAVSPCGDALSIDAARRAWRRGDGTARRPVASVAYGLPVRLTWLLIATTYLFPGIWKYASAGWSWAFSDNVRTIMYEHWTRLEGYTPPLPIDQWPLAYQLGGAAVIVFEIGFVVFVLGRATRPLAAVAGLAFHNANFVFLRLSFATLQITYVAFVPWSRLFAWLGLHAPRVEVDARTPLQLRRLGALRALDPVGIVQPRVPLGHREGVADDSSSSPSGSGGCGSVGVIAVVGGLILSANALAGVGAVTSAWPFACYPTFAGIARTHRPEPIFVLDRPDGSSQELDAVALRDLISWESFDSMARPIVDEEPDARARAEALVNAVEEAGIEIPSGTSIAVYRTDAPLDPNAASSGERELLFILER